MCSNRNQDLIYFSNVIPKDVSRIKLLLYTIFFGFLGINHFYVKRKIRWAYSMISTIGSILILIIAIAVGTNTFFNVLYYILFAMMSINLILWVSDIFNVLFGLFKIPVVLSSKEEK